MPPSTGSGGATPDLNQRLRAKVVTLPPAGRQSQLERWGITPEHVGALRAQERRGALADESDSTGSGHDGALDGPEPGARGFVQGGGWHALEPAKGSQRGGGTTSHRGVLHPDEHVDRAALGAAVAERLGFSLAEIRSVYRQGRLSDEDRALRARIDARLLEVSEAGGQTAELGRALGWAVRADGHCRPMERALARARLARKGDR